MEADRPGQKHEGKTEEKVRLSVKARYEEFSENSIEGAEGTLAALLSAFGPTTIGLEGSQSYQAISEALGSTALMGKDDMGVPHAYLNYLLFDENFQLQDMGFQHITDEGRVTESSMDAVETVSLEEIVIQQSGYLYTWVSNESNWDVTVYFDDFTIEHDTYIVSSQDYYAFGAVHSAERRSVGLNNKYQYQGKEWQADLNLALYDFHARQYDPYLGRFTSIDPQSQFASGYVGMGNNPVIGVDPDGEWVNFVIGAVVGGVGGYSTGKALGKTGWDLFAYTIAGAGIGAATSGIGTAVTASTSASLGAAGSTIVGGAAAGTFNGAAMAALGNGSIGQGALYGGIGGIAGSTTGLLNIGCSICIGNHVTFFSSLSIRRKILYRL